MQLVEVFGLRLFTRGLQSAVSQVSSAVRGDSLVVVFTPNPEQVVFASKHRSFFEVLRTADILLPDGVGIVIAAAIRGVRLARIPGRVFVTRFLAELNQHEDQVGVMFVGGKEGVADKAAQRVSEDYPKLVVCSNSGSQDVQHETIAEWQEVLQIVRSAKPKILIAGFGAPKQEFWIHRHKAELEQEGVRVVIAAGGTVDVLAGTLLAPPKILEYMGLEWCWRLAQQPWRWRRQLALIAFVKLMISSSSLEKR